MSTPRDTRLKALILTRSLPRRDALSLKGRLLMLRNRSSRKKGQIGTVYNNSSDAGDDHANAT